MNYFLEAKGITKHFGGITALHDVSLKLLKGEVHCLVGENGAGKSTLGKAIAGIIRIDSGEIEIRNEKVNKINEKEDEKTNLFVIDLYYGSNRMYI